MAAVDSNRGRFAFDLDRIRSHNRGMPSTTQPSKKQPKSRVKASDKQLSNAELLKLAVKNRPPQAWYDDESDPTKPAASNGRGK